MAHDREWQGDRGVEAMFDKGLCMDPEVFNVMHPLASPQHREFNAYMWATRFDKPTPEQMAAKRMREAHLLFHPDAYDRLFDGSLPVEDAALNAAAWAQFREISLDLLGYDPTEGHAAVQWVEETGTLRRWTFDELQQLDREGAGMNWFWRILFTLGALTFLGGGLDILSTEGCEEVDFGGSRQRLPPMPVSMRARETCPPRPQVP